MADEGGENLEHGLQLLQKCSKQDAEKVRKLERNKTRLYRASLMPCKLRRYNEETKFSVTPSFVLTHSSDSI